MGFLYVDCCFFLVFAKFALPSSFNNSVDSYLNTYNGFLLFPVVLLVVVVCLMNFILLYLLGLNLKKDRSLLVSDNFIVIASEKGFNLSHFRSTGLV